MNRLLALICALLLVCETAASVQCSAAIYRVSERNGSVVLTVTRTGESLGAASVAFSTSVNSASPDRDFISTNGTLNWAVGDTANKSIEILILQDSFEEEPQDFLVTLSDPVGESIGARNSAQVMIDDPAVRFEELYGSAFGAPARFDLIVSVAGFAATRVEFLEGETLLGMSSEPRPDGNFAIVWENVPRGNYTIRARAFDAQNASITSPSRTLLISGPVAGANLAAVYVDQNSISGVETGSVVSPFKSIQRAVDNAAPNAIIKVAVGTYRESILIDNITLQITGGYLPGFAARDPIRRTAIEPNGGRAGFGLYNAGNTLIEGFAISGASRGFLITADTLAQSYPKLRRNVITGNGEAYRAHGGGGIHSETSNLELVGNEITNNKGGRGGGVLAGSVQATVVMRDNLIRGNLGYDDHGGGLYVMANGVIAGNRIENNEVGKAVDYGGWGGGLILFGNSNDFFPVVALSNNIVTGNYAINGSAEFFDEGVRATVDHELIYKNRTSPTGGGAIMVDGCCNTSVIVNQSTVADNEGHLAAGNGLNSDILSSAEIRNSIFWNNGGGEFVALSGSTIQIRYTLSDDALVTGDGIIAGPGNLQIDPGFADASNNDYRLKSISGRWSPVTRRWVQDRPNSAGVDAADPIADFSWEALPHGGRADLGAFGNRAEANLSATLVGNQFRINVNGVNGRPYQLERADTLETWNEVTTLTSTTGQIEYSETIGSTPRYYRLRQ